MALTPTFRQALPTDAEAMVPLIHSSGPEAFNYVFGQSNKDQASGFLRYCFNLRTGQFGADNHWVAEVDGEVLGSLTLYSGKDMLGYTLNSFIRIVSFYGLIDGFKVMLRGVKTESVIRPPKACVRYIAHLAVTEDARGKGIGSKLIAFAEQLTHQDNIKVIALDVATTNTNAHELYKAKGFADKKFRKSTLVSEFGSVPDHMYMEKAL